MIPRAISRTARQFATQFKVVAIVGPRQAGKTTLARSIFAAKPYVSLETPDALGFASDDPRAFLARYPDGAVIDEAQRCPHLFSYIQGLVDDRREPGIFILTGSQHFGLMQAVTQSLAGRVGFLRLLPFSLPELSAAGCAPASLELMLYRGGYPPVYDQPVEPESWLDAYITAYVERDVRQLVNIRDLAAFRLFVRLCAGHVGQLFNASRIGADVGIDQKTATSWLGILESSFIAFRLPPHFRNFRKRLVKTPKLYFHDTGLVCRLLGIVSPDQIVTHPLRGALFENWVITELLKGRYDRGKSENLFFWRSHMGREVDVLADHGERLLPVEVKSGSTIANDWIDDVLHWTAMAGEAAECPALVYGGAEAQQRRGVDIVPWRNIGDLAARA